MVDYITILSETSILAESGHSQSFESAAFPNQESEVCGGGNSHNEQHWERTEDAASVGNSSLRIKSQNYSFARESHAFSTPELDISEFAPDGTGVADLWISFDYAYARRLPYTAGNLDDDGFDYDGDQICDAGDLDDDNDNALDEVDSDDNNEFICSDDDTDTCDDCSSGTYNTSVSYTHLTLPTNREV